MFRPSICLLKDLSTRKTPQLSTRLLQKNQQLKPGIVENTVYVTPLSSPVDRHWLRMEVAELLELKDGDGIVRVRTIHDSSGTRYGVGFVELANEKLAKELLKCVGARIDRLFVTFRPAKIPINPPHNPRPKALAPTPIPSQTVYVSNLPHSTSKETLEEIFSSFGTVKQIAITAQEDAIKVLRGSAFITFQKQWVADTVVRVGKRDGILVGSRLVSVDYKSKSVDRDAWLRAWMMN